MNRPRIYLAAGWFNPAQKKQMDEIHAVLDSMRANGYLDFFSPFYDGIVLKKDDPDLRKKMKQVWDLDIQKLSDSDLVIASTQDHDVGTIFECGYASANHIPIICYNSNPELGLNVMLAQEARGFVKSQGQLEEAIRSFVLYRNDHGRSMFKMDYWRFNLWEGEPI